MLETIKAGNYILKSISYDGAVYWIRKKVRVTSTWIILDKEEKFKKKDGRSINSDIWCFDLIKTFGEDDMKEVLREEKAYRDAIEKSKLLVKIQRVNFNSLNLRTLQDIEQLIEKNRKKEN